MRVNLSIEVERDRIKSLMSEQITFLGGPSIASPKNAIKTFDWMRTWNRHDWLNFVEATSTILAMIPQPAAPITSPILFGIGTTAGIVNAKLYFDEGDEYTGGLVLAMSVIPGGELIRILKNSKTFMMLGPKKSIELLKSIKSKTATVTQKKMGQELIKELAPNADELAEETMKYTVKKMLQQLPKMSFRSLLKLCIGLSKLGIFGIKQGIVFAGTFLAYDKIYQALNYKNEKNLSKRDKNELVNLYNTITNNEEEIKNKMMEQVLENQSEILKRSGDIIKVDTTSQITFK